jgi:acetyl-CoA acetyltransferase
MLFSTCLEYARTAHYDDLKKYHAVQLMTVITRCLLNKNDLAGWEVMELFAGGVNQSDKFFNVLMSTKTVQTMLF